MTPFREIRDLDQAFREHQPYLIKFLSAKGIHRADAQDILSEAWSTVAEHPEHFRGASQFRTYLTGIVINKSREWSRKQNKLRPMAEEEPQQRLESMMDQHFTPEGWWRNPPKNPDQLFQTKEIGLLIQECLKTLSAAQREAFALREIDDTPVTAICETLKINAKHLGVILFRAKHKLRLCLEGRV